MQKKMLNKRTAQKYFKSRAAMDQQDADENLQEIKRRYVAGIITERQYKTLLNYYYKANYKAQRTARKKYTYKPKRKKKK